MIAILEANLNDEPILILEDDVEFTGQDEVDLSNADAVYLGVSKDGASMTQNTHDGPCMYEPIITSPERVRVTNMLSLHAKVYISKVYKIAVIEALKKAKQLQE